MAVCSYKDGHDHLIKLVLIGDSGVGKSSLLSRFTKSKFRVDEKPTTANNIVSRHVCIDGKTVKAQIVDIAGNHRFRDFKNDIQMQNARGALIVYDVTRHDSTFEEVEKWYKELHTANSELEIMLIGNKTDLLEDDSLMTTSIEAGKEFAERASLGFIDTSAKDDRNVEKAFAELVSRIFRKIIKNDGIDTTDSPFSPAISSEALLSRSSGEYEPAHYMLKIECFSVLFEAGTRVFESDIFEAGGYKWRLELYPNGSNEEENTSGYISVYVAICDTESLPKGWEVWIYAKFFVYDHVCQNYIVFQDVDQKRTRIHETNRKWCISKLISLDSFSDTRNGCLFHDSCVFGAEVFAALKYAVEDQRLSMIKPPAITKTHTWTIDNFSEIAEDVLYSDYFKVGKVKCFHSRKLSLYPKGNDAGKDTHLSIYLQVHDSNCWRVYANYVIRVKNQNSIADRVRRHKHWFDEDVCGTQRFLLLSELHDLDKGYLLNDVLTVEAAFSVVGMLKDFD